MIDELSEFASVYAARPIQDNPRGMKSPHLFALWFMAKRLSPELVVESGVLRGQSTWLLEQACPEAKLICIDPALEKRTYISDRAVYSPKDFAEHDWADVPERSLAFFDDHQNAYLRIQQCAWFGFRHVIFEDNYPPGRGDCYSLKKAFAGAGHAQDDGAVRPARGSLARISDALRRRLGSSGRTAPQPALDSSIPPNEIDAKMLERRLAVYREFPPVFKPAQTRWGDDWSDEAYLTPDPLLTEPEQPAHQVYLDEAMYYTWICYARLR